MQFELENRHYPQNYESFNVDNHPFTALLDFSLPRSLCAGAQIGQDREHLWHKRTHQSGELAGI